MSSNIPFDSAICDLVEKFREIPMNILAPAFRIVELEEMER